MAKKKSASGSISNTKQQQPVCKCSDIYKCSCLNRPERPSNGHKWDSESQAWVGKGHRQKGGSHALTQSIVVTEMGQTSIASYQSLPSKILMEYCKQEKRPQPRFTLLPQQKSNKEFKYRCIVPDGRKNSEKDLIFIPSHSCQNEEQAHEEAALLALLKLTPSLPHERKLPEPYKSTWLHATASSTNDNNNIYNAVSNRQTQQDQPQDVNGTTRMSNTVDTKSRITPTQDSLVVAVASRNLTAQTSYTSMAEQRQHEAQKQQARKMKFAKHEAMRLANKDHPCFMSVAMRKRIETLLRGGESYMDDDDDERNATDDDSGSDEVRADVIGRLKNEGFTSSQARKAYAAISTNNNQTRSNTTTTSYDEEFDKTYDHCLQWLCIHLNEDQLPEGFNPSGQTLDVLVKPKNKKKQTDSGSDQSKHNHMDELVINRYGLTNSDAKTIVSMASTAFANNDNLCSTHEEAIHNVLWNELCCASGVDVDYISNRTVVATNSTDGTIDMQQENIDLMTEEFEALSAIFSPDECCIGSGNSDEHHNQNVTVVSLLLPDADFVQHVRLKIYIQRQRYPCNVYPMVLVSGTWKTENEGIGVHINSEIVKFLFGLPLGEPMIYELYGFTFNLLQNYCVSRHDKQVICPVPFLMKIDTKSNKNVSNSSDDNQPAVASTKSSSRGSGQQRPFRPREKSDFWSKLPHIATPAAENPKVSRDINESRRNLPAAIAREEFLHIMKQSDEIGLRVSLVTGSTGCGKSTQLPQFILENQPGYAKIVVAQPRRLAATGVANRVAAERGERAPGLGSVGYAVRGDVKCSKNTRLLFCTTGVLLRQMQSERALENITHIIVDECHERNLDTDILLGLLKNVLPTLPHLKVILMSATMDAEKFAAYYGENTPSMHIPGFAYPVRDFGLEDILDMTGYVPRQKGRGKKKGAFGKSRQQSPWFDSETIEGENERKGKGDEASLEKNDIVKGVIEPQTRISSEELLKRMTEGEIDYDLIATLIRYLIKNEGDDGSILVFLPGAPEISMAGDVIRRVTKGMSVEVLPLHGGLQPNDQNLVFRKAAVGFTKVILATNVAETSITIPDCTCVVDSCREKQSSYDPISRMPLLLEQFASLDSLKQRRGRAGRVRSGVYYQLISARTKAKLRSHGVPEISRCALDSAILSLLFIGVEDGKGSFLKTMIDPPPQESIDSSMFSLVKTKAVDVLPDGRAILTPLGMHLAGIPAPPAVGKLIVMGSILGCRTASLAIAAFMSLGRSPFLNIDLRHRNPAAGISEADDAMKEEQHEEESRKRSIIKERENMFKIVGNSDHALIACAFLKWLEIETDRQGDNKARKFCDLLGLSHIGLRDMKQLITQYDSSLRSIGFVVESQSDANSKSWRVVRSCVVAALSSSQLVRVQRPTAKYNETSVGALEKDGKAKEVKLYVRTAGTVQLNFPEDYSVIKSSETANYLNDDGKEERVFFHPSSSNFGVGKFSCPWLVYHDLVRTSKAFLRGATECSAYALLLFGGDIEVQASNNVVVVDNWVRLSASTRIGALVGGLRRKVDDLLTAKVANPSLDITSSAEIKTVVKLLVGDGLDN